MADNASGRFIWRELMTSNVNDAKRFYGELFGWSIKEWTGGDKPYFQLYAGNNGIGGMMPCPEGAPMPSLWTSYVYVDDVDACVARAKSAGGKIYYGPVDIPTIGRLAYIADPNGAATAVIKPQPRQGQSTQGSGGDRPAAGEFCWESLQTPNPKADVAFYTKVYDWNEGSFGDAITLGVGEGMTNQVASVGPVQGGMPANWTTYVAVDGLAAVRDRATRLGGTIVMDAVPVPTMGTFAVIRDPQGAVICLFEAEQR